MTMNVFKLSKYLLGLHINQIPSYCFGGLIIVDKRELNF